MLKIICYLALSVLAREGIYSFDCTQYIQDDKISSCQCNNKPPSCDETLCKNFQSINDYKSWKTNVGFRNLGYEWVDCKCKSPHCFKKEGEGEEKKDDN